MPLLCDLSASCFGPGLNLKLDLIVSQRSFQIFLLVLNIEKVIYVLKFWQEDHYFHNDKFWGKKIYPQYLVAWMHKEYVLYKEHIYSEWEQERLSLWRKLFHVAEPFIWSATVTSKQDKEWFVFMHLS